MEKEHVFSLVEILSDERIRNQFVYGQSKSRRPPMNFDPERNGEFYHVFFHGTNEEREEYIGRGLPILRDWLAGILNAQGISPYAVGNLVRIAEFLVRTNQFYDNHCSRLDSDKRTRQFFTARGLLFYGQCGTGKTLIAENIAQRWDFIWLPVVRAESVFLDGEEGPDYYHEYWGQYVEDPSRVIVVDDLGRESGDKCWGRSFPIADLLETRFQLWQRYRTPTVFTTNLPDMSAIEQRYGAALKRRLLEMTEPVFFDGSAEKVTSQSTTARAVGADGDTSWLDSYNVPCYP